MSQDEDLAAVLIDSGATLDNGGRKLTIGGLYRLNGTHNATSGGARVTFNGLTEAEIDGVGGVLNAKSLIFEGVIREVVSGADICMHHSSGCNFASSAEGSVGVSRTGIGGPGTAGTDFDGSAGVGSCCMGFDSAASV